MVNTPGQNHTLSHPLKPRKESERYGSVVPAGDGSAGVVTTSVDIFAVLGAKGLSILRRPQRDRGTGKCTVLLQKDGWRAVDPAKNTHSQKQVIMHCLYDQAAG